MLSNVFNYMRMIHTDTGESETETEDMTKDDSSPQTKIAYYVLLGCFVILAFLGLTNIFLAHKIRKFSKPIVTFYLASELVIVFRIVLFMDPFFNWSDTSYVVLLVSMPSYLFILVGLSQVMLTLESIVKYKNFKIREEPAIGDHDLKQRVARN